MSVRFAPSPTGEFHLGNFRTAWISHWWAKSLKMPWVVRFEDIDAPRNIPGVRESQLREMELLGLKADRVLLQSSNRARHWEALQKFFEAGLIYPCFCSRKEVRAAVEGLASAPHGPVPSYNGACRDLSRYPQTNNPTLAWRARMPDESGRDDFVVARTDLKFSQGKPDEASFVPAYNWACAIDDWDEGHQLLVRAWDLEEVLFQQRWIQGQLAQFEKKAFDPIAVFHAALVLNGGGERLEKRSRGALLREVAGSADGLNGLIRKFEGSFRASASEYAPGLVFGEPFKTLSLNELGIRPDRP